jgi:hypothetical protein
MTIDAPDEKAALQDLRDAIGHARPLRPEHAMYLEVLAVALADARRLALRPASWPILRDRRSFLQDELRSCGVEDAVIRMLIFGVRA